MASLNEIARAKDALREHMLQREIAASLGDINWSYDAAGKPAEAVQRRNAIVMGFNPGANGVGSSARWRNRCNALTQDVEQHYVMAELVFISTLNIGELSKKHDVPELIRLCAPVNRAIIDYHKPKVIIQTGFGWLEQIADVYGLRAAGDPIRRPQHDKHSLLKHYRMSGRETDWLKHGVLQCRHRSNPHIYKSAVSVPDADRSFVSVTATLSAALRIDSPTPQRA